MKVVKKQKAQNVKYKYFKISGSFCSFAHEPLPMRTQPTPSRQGVVETTETQWELRKPDGLMGAGGCVKGVPTSLQI